MDDAYGLRSALWWAECLMTKENRDMLEIQLPGVARSIILICGSAASENDMRDVISTNEWRTQSLEFILL